MRLVRSRAFAILLAVWCIGVTSASAQQLRSYIQFPDPLRPRTATSPWTVANLCKAYNVPKSQPGGGVIGILELGGGFTQSDLDKFSQLNGLPKITATAVSVGGGQNLPGSNDDFEVLLDIEVAAATYYYATGKMPTIKVFFAPNSTNAFAAVVTAAVQQQCDVLSISWGAPEKYWSKTSLIQLDNLIASAATSGLTVFAASGDNSSSDGATGTNVDAPACCPHIVACGGTTKTTTSEKVWGTGSPTALGTGGGYSTYFSKQSFQVGAPANATGRLVPDVAADADPNTGYLIYVHGGQYMVGGTSAVAPLYAGLFASYGKKLGFVSPKLWSNRTSFTDITVGSNGAYSATVGPDACTGLGVPNGTLIAAVVKTSVKTVFQVAAVGANAPTGTVSLSLSDLEFASQDVVTGVSGSSADLSGGYHGVVINLSSLFGAGSKSSIIGVGGSLTQPYVFTGAE